MANVFTKAFKKLKGDHLVKCPMCQFFYNSQKLDPAAPGNCKVCGMDLSISEEEARSFRWTDEELTEGIKKIEKHFLKKKAGVVLSGLAMLISFGTGWVFLGIPLLLVFLYFLMVAFGKDGAIKTLVSHNITRDIIAETFDDASYYPKSHISLEKIKEASLIYNWNEESGSDLVEGTYKGHAIEFSDVHLEDVQETTDSDGNTSKTYVTRFKGQWLICELDKDVQSSLRLREKYERKGKVSKKLFGERQKIKSDMQTENERFNERFQIITQNLHNAFYILTPHFMEFILKADDMADAQTYLCFIENRVHILSYTNQNSLEVGKIKSNGISYDVIRNRMRGELKYITSILDELLKNEYLFGQSKK